MHIRCMGGMPTWHGSPDWCGSVPCGLLVVTLDECADPLSDAGVPTQNLSQMDGPMTEPECAPPDLARASGPDSWLGRQSEPGLSSHIVASRASAPSREIGSVAGPSALTRESSTTAGVRHPA